MKKFDRITSILIHLQTHPLAQARVLAEKFGVTERTIYRDIRTLENAGVPIAAEPGLGYYLDKRYHLPPVMFSRDEAAALLIGSKIIENRVDQQTDIEYQQAMDKVRSVLDSSDRTYLDSIDDDIAVSLPLNNRQSARDDSWLGECRTALSRRQLITIDYVTVNGSSSSNRSVEPIGLYFYSHHWHLIGYCRLREDYRDFRLDRISTLALQPEQFQRRDIKNLHDYLLRLRQRSADVDLHEIELRFSHKVIRYVNEQRYFFGLVSEEQTDDGVVMRFLVAQLELFGRWLLPYTDAVELLQGEALAKTMQRLLAELGNTWGARNNANPDENHS